MNTLIPLARRKTTASGGILNTVNAILLIALLTTGCSSLEVDRKEPMETGLMPFSHGEVTSTMNASLKQSWEAAQRAAKELGMTPELLQYTPPTAVMIARTSIGKRMEVHLKKAGFATTSIAIQMGPKGDELLQRQFLSKLENLL